MEKTYTYFMRAMQMEINKLTLSKNIKNHEKN